MRESVARELQTHLESLAEDYAKMLRNPVSDNTSPGSADNGDSV